MHRSYIEFSETFFSLRYNNYPPVRSIIRPLVVLLAMFILAASSSAAVDLSGPNGRTILQNLQNVSNKTTAPNNVTNFWSWGFVPKGHAIKNGTLVDSPYIVLNPGEDSGVMETPAQAMGLNDTVINGIME
jgi:hypothetical protein